MAILLRLSSPDVEKQKASKYWLICSKNSLTSILFLSSVFALETIPISLGHLSKLIPSLIWEYFSDRQPHIHEQPER